MEIVEKGFEIVLVGKASAKQKALDVELFSKDLVVEHLQVVVNAPSVYRQEKSLIPQ